jgi:hypothetical protein
MPSTASLNALHDVFSSNVGVPLLTSGTLYGKDVNAFNYAIQKKIGWRVDCWGDYDTSGWNHMRDLYPCSGHRQPCLPVQQQERRGPPAVMYSAVQHMITKLGYRFVLTRAVSKVDRPRREP